MFPYDNPDSAFLAYPLFEENCKSRNLTKDFWVNWKDLHDFKRFSSLSHYNRLGWKKKAKKSFSFSTFNNFSYFSILKFVLALNYWNMLQKNSWSWTETCSGILIELSWYLEFKHEILFERRSWITSSVAQWNYIPLASEISIVRTEPKLWSIMAFFFFFFFFLFGGAYWSHPTLQICLSS